MTDPNTQPTPAPVMPEERPTYHPYGCFDAKEWATAFCDRFPQGPDHGTMLGWFANAIMTGYDRREAEEARAALPAAGVER